MKKQRLYSTYSDAKDFHSHEVKSVSQTGCTVVTKHYSIHSAQVEQRMRGETAQIVEMGKKS